MEFGTADPVLAGDPKRPQILLEDGFYLVGQSALLRRQRRVDETVGSVLSLGHNP